MDDKSYLHSDFTFVTNIFDLGAGLLYLVYIRTYIKDICTGYSTY